MARIRTAVMVACVTLLGTCAGGVQAEANRLNERYSQGLHAYYAGEFATAHRALSDVIKAGFQNPCCYYFRGMSSYQQGDKQAAQQDFQAGAELEANAIRQKFPISKSLERVQGGVRVMIERARLQARLVVLQKRLTREKQRYEALVRNEAKVLRKAPDPPGAAEPAIEIKSKAANDPFAAGGAGLTGSPVAAGATAKPAAVGTGVIADGNQEPAPAAPAAKKDANPFGEPAADDADAAKPAPAKDDAEANPFGAPADDDADAAKPAPAKDDAKDDAEANPFGAPADDDADAAKPAPAKDDAEANPFGAPAGGADAPQPEPAEQPEPAATAAQGDNPLSAVLRAFSKVAGVDTLIQSGLGNELQGLIPQNPFSDAGATSEGHGPQEALPHTDGPPQNPFAEPAAPGDAVQPAPAEKPAPAAPAKEEENPFGEPEAPGDAAQPAPAEKPAAANSNPFDAPEKDAATPAKPSPAAKPQAPAEENPFD